jgi:acyl-CoA dehydrogenase
MPHPLHAPPPMDEFARSRIAGRALYRADAFPVDLWQEMAEAGLFGIGLPERLGGAGGGYAEIAAALAALVEMGGSPGFAAAWAAQQMFARATILRFGSEVQRTALVPAMAAGRLALAFAVSEPGAGAHPKHLKTTAERHGDRHRLTGEKTHVTNGPIAGLFVVIAVSAVEPGNGETGGRAGRKRFSAFLVPRDAPGLEIVPAPPLRTLRPMTHCMLRLNSCEVPESALLGPPGVAFETLAMPFRDTEDAILTSGFAGTFRRLLRLLAAATDTSDAAAADTAATDLGALAALAAVLDNTAATLATGFDAEPRAAPDRNSVEAALLAGSRMLCIDLLERMRAYRNGRVTLGNRSEDEIDFLLADVTTLLSIAKGVRLVKQNRLGAALLRREEQPAA